MDVPPIPELSRRRFYRATKVRSYRLEKGVLLADAARRADPPLTLARASEIERSPHRAYPGELERLLSGVDRATGFDQAEPRLNEGRADVLAASKTGDR